MSNLPKRLLVLSIGALLIGVSDWPASTTRFLVPECQAIRNWVTAHAQSLPQTLDEIAAYPLAYRRAIFSSLRPEVKAALWREQMTRFLRTHRLSPEQRAFSETARSHAIPARWDRSRPRTPEEERHNTEFHQYVRSETLRLFSFEERQAFLVLGSVIPVIPLAARVAFPDGRGAEAVRADNSPRGSIQLVNFRLAGAGETRSRSMAQCECATSDNWCDSGACGEGSCHSVAAACGWFWCENCNGSCGG